jgi:MFS family permease
MQKNKHLAMTIALMVTIIVDVMGIGLVFPVLPGLFFNETYAIVAPDMSPTMRNFFYGVCLTAWPLGIFFGAPYLGDLSDKLSRKKVILMCLFGMIISNAFSGFAVHLQALWLFVFARFLAGFFSGSFPIAQASMIDISDDSTKSRNLSLVTLAASMGFVVGPLITSISTLPSLSGIFNYTTPFYVATVLSLLNFIGVWRFLPEIVSHHKVDKVHFFRGILVIREVLSDVRTRRCLFAFFLMFFGWGTYFCNLPLLLANYFDYGTSMIAVIFAVFAFGNIAGILFIQPVMLKKFSLNQCCVIMAVALAVVVTASSYTAHVWVQWLVAFCAPAIQMVLYTAVMTMFSNSVTPQEQGKVMGGADAAVSIAFMLNGMLLGVLVNVNLIIPIIVAGLAILVSAPLFKKVQSSQVQH